MLPIARADQLTIQELDNETLIFDHATGKAHCLNRTAGQVYARCDGQTSAAEMANHLGLDAAVVSLALQQLQRRNLIVAPSQPLPIEAVRSRRDALRKLAAAAALIPAIMTVTAPKASAQASCVQLGGACTSTAQCCPGVGISCNQGICAQIT